MGYAILLVRGDKKAKGTILSSSWILGNATNDGILIILLSSSSKAGDQDGQMLSLAPNIPFFSITGI
jgi:hypothetical protein